MIEELKPDMGSPKTPEKQKQNEIMDMVDRINSLSTGDIEKIAETLRRIVEERQKDESKENEEK